MIGAIIGFLVGLAWIVLREIKQDKFKNKETLIKVDKAPVLGVISTKKS